MTLKVDGTNGVLQAYDYQVLTTGFTYTFAAGVQTLVINPAGTLATGTITMPAAPVDGMVVTVTSTQPITVLTVNANTGQTINNGGSLGLQAGGVLSYMYNLANTKWQPFNACLPIGVGQTWQAVTRTTATTYTNTTGRPIAVNLSVGSGAGAYGGILVSINGGTAFVIAQSQNQSGANAGNGSVIIPAGNTYVFSVSGNSSITAAQELR